MRERKIPKKKEIKKRFLQKTEKNPEQHGKGKRIRTNEIQGTKEQEKKRKEKKRKQKKNHQENMKGIGFGVQRGL